VEIFHHRFDEFRAAPRAIEVVIAQKQASALRPRPLGRDPEGARMPKV
jgi:hypothetical protein